MKIRSVVLVLALCVSLLACTSSNGLDTQASTFVLDAQASWVEFSSTKNQTITEKHRFKVIDGSLAEGVNAHLTIDMSSVNTGIDIRNERLGEHLFKVSVYPEVIVQVPLAEVDTQQLKLGDTALFSVDIRLSMLGIEHPLKADLNVTRQTQALLVESASPVIVTTDQFGMSTGVEKLKELAGLQHIASDVPVSVSLRFQALTSD